MSNSFNFVSSYTFLMEDINTKIKNELKKNTDDTSRVRFLKHLPL